MAAGQVRGPLHGIPILLKDNIATHDRMTTTAGSYALEGSIPPADSGVARKLREAGAVLLGKDEPERVGQLPVLTIFLRLERTGRAVQKPLRVGQKPLRVQFGIRGCGLCESLRCRHRHGDERVHRLPCQRKRCRGNQANRGPGEP